jgi:hypothetical protein
MYVKIHPTAYEGTSCFRCGYTSLHVKVHPTAGEDAVYCMCKHTLWLVKKHPAACGEEPSAGVDAFAQAKILPMYLDANGKTQ